MKRLTRYTTSHGAMCKDSEVAKLEASHAEMLKLLEQWHSIAEEYTSYPLVGETRAAIAKAKGETL
jgi:glycine cleavage system regulatory protein